MMKRLYTCCVAIAVLFSACSKKGQSGADAVNDADRAFAMKAGPLYLAGYELGLLAFNNSSDSTIIKLAEKMVMTSNTGYNNLIQLSTLKGFIVPSYMDTAHVNIKTDLSAMSGADFDSAYVHLLVEDQHELLTAFDVLQEIGNNMNLKSHAKAYRDTMFMYHVEADSLAELY